VCYARIHLARLHIAIKIPARAKISGENAESLETMRKGAASLIGNIRYYVAQLEFTKWDFPMQVITRKNTSTV
jgi:hypothetical protein